MQFPTLLVLVSFRQLLHVIQGLVQRGGRHAGGGRSGSHTGLTNLFPDLHVKLLNQLIVRPDEELA